MAQVLVDDGVGGVDRPVDELVEGPVLLSEPHLEEHGGHVAHDGNLVAAEADQDVKEGVDELRPLEHAVVEAQALVALCSVHYRPHFGCCRLVLVDREVGEEKASPVLLVRRSPDVVLAQPLVDALLVLLSVSTLGQVLFCLLPDCEGLPVVVLGSGLIPPEGADFHPAAVEPAEGLCHDVQRQPVLVVGDAPGVGGFGRGSLRPEAEECVPLGRGPGLARAA